MTNTTDRVPGATAAAQENPRRRVLVGLAVLILALFGVLLGTSTDISYDTTTAKITDAYDMSRTANQVGAYVGMVFVAVVLFFASALRGALRRSGAGWLAESSFLGLTALAATIGTWIVIDVAMWEAVDFGDDSTIRALATISDAAFLPLMASMIALYVGTGLAGLTTGALPRWLAIASLVVGVIAPVGPLGFIGFIVLPVWVVAVSVWVRLDA